jgi:peptidoglycan/xylan/chitin deacetylase (PgdA/CDA1 family)
MTGRFIISLDCEGHWGMADKPRVARSYVTHEALMHAYEALLALFEEFEMAATFAFVGMFTLTNVERDRFAPQLGDLPYRGESWLKHYHAEMAAGQEDGWFCPEAFEAVRAAPQHEIASHGFSHIPFDGPDTPPEVLRHEFEMAQAIAKTKGVDMETFIFSRNQIGALAALGETGFTGYRAALGSSGGRFGAPALRLAREMYVLDRAQPDVLVASDGMVTIPPGYFLNWRHGIRGMIPPALIVARWRHILRSAARHGQVAHIWTHPHNFISAPQTLDMFRNILAQAAQLRDAGKLQLQTQAAYVQTQR